MTDFGKYLPEAGLNWSDGDRQEREHRALEKWTVAQQAEEGQRRANENTYFPFKVAVIRWDGSANGDPAQVGTSFNASVAKGASTGVYRVTFDQSTLLGANILDFFYPLATLFMADTGNSFQWGFTAADPGGAWFEITIYVLGVQGQSLTRTPVDMGAADKFWLYGLANFIDPAAQPLPA